jgi:hypothetical protein
MEVDEVAGHAAILSHIVAEEDTSAPATLLSEETEPGNGKRWTENEERASDRRRFPFPVFRLTILP